MGDAGDCVSGVRRRVPSPWFPATRRPLLQVPCDDEDAIVPLERCMTSPPSRPPAYPPELPWPPPTQYDLPSGDDENVEVGRHALALRLPLGVLDRIWRD